MHVIQLRRTPPTNTTRRTRANQAFEGLASRIFQKTLGMEISLMMITDHVMTANGAIRHDKQQLNCELLFLYVYDIWYTSKHMACYICFIIYPTQEVSRPAISIPLPAIAASQNPTGDLYGQVDVPRGTWKTLSKWIMGHWMYQHHHITFRSLMTPSFWWGR